MPCRAGHLRLEPPVTAFNPVLPALRIALLIDGDNIQPEHVGQALARLKPLGTVAIRRAYGNWEQHKGVAAALQEHAVRAFHQPKLSQHKNGSDIALAIDAIDLLHTQPPDAFAILSSDADFTALMLRLREAGREVYGFGEAKAAAALRTACTEFFELDGPPDAVLAVLRKTIAACKGPDGRALLSRIAQALPRDRIKYKKLSTLLREHGFELSQDNKYCIVR